MKICTSRHDLESSEILHVISSTSRSRRQLAAVLTNAISRVHLREATRVLEKAIDLYCTNRTSLENLFYARTSSIYTKDLGSY